MGGTVGNDSSTTQHCVKLSTREAENVAVKQGVKTALLTRSKVARKNQGAITMAEIPVSGGRTTHIDVGYDFIIVERKALYADFLSKPLGPEAFVGHRAFSRICLIYIYMYFS